MFQNFDDKVKTKFAIVSFVVAFALFVVTSYVTQIWPLTSGSFLGIVSKLPVYFWASIIIVYAGLILAYQTRNVLLFLSGIMVLTTILFITPAILQPYGSHPVSYGVTGVSKQIVSGEMSPSNVPWLAMPYIAYQVFPMFITAVETITNLSGVDLIRFFPALSVLLFSLLFFILCKRIGKNLQLAFLSVMVFVPMFYWHVFLVPELLSFALLLVFFIVYELSESSPSRANSILVMLVLVALSLVHIMAPLMAIIFLGLKSFMAQKGKRRHAFMFFISSLTIYLGWMSYAAYRFFNQSIFYIFSSYSNWDSLLSSLTVGQVGVVVPFERLLLRYITLIPFATSFVLAGVAILVLILKKKHRTYSTAICALFSSLLLLAVPYGSDMSLIRTAEFVLLSTSFLTGLFLIFLKESKNRYLKRLKIFIFILPLFFVLLQPIAYNGASATTAIPLTEISGTHFFVMAPPEKIVFYFSQSSQGVINYQDPDRAYVGSSSQRVFSLWYPPIYQFDLNEGFNYVLHGQRDDNGLISYLGYDPVVNASAKINLQFNYIYDNGEFSIYYRNYNLG